MFLDAIVADVDDRAKRLLPVSRYLRERALAMPPGRSLHRALDGPALAVIAECKQKSPSKGWLTDAYDPVAQAQQYERQGANAISVLTEPKFFAGDLVHLEAVRSAVDLPILRKDFVRDPVQLYEARAYGADAVLLIVRIVDGPRLSDLYQTAVGIGLEVVVEIHSPREAERALVLRPAMVGVNNRDLDTFETRLEFSRDMAEVVPPSLVRISESGITAVSDLDQVSAWGYHAVLIGESLMRGSELLTERTHDPR